MNGNKLEEMMEREQGNIPHDGETKYSAVKSSLIPFLFLKFLSLSLGTQVSACGRSRNVSPAGEQCPRLFDTFVSFTN